MLNVRNRYDEILTEISFEIANIFEDILAEREIVICNEGDEEDREDTEDPAYLFGCVYYEVEDKIRGKLHEFTHYAKDEGFIIIRGIEFLDEEQK